MAFVDTKERIFVNGQIYSRPIGGGPVHGPDTRRFTPDPNPYDVPPEPRGYGQGTVDDLLFRPGIDKFEIENPVLRPGDTYEVLPLDYLNQYLNNRGITEQNQEVMGSKEQVFPRYANPEDGTLTFGGPEAEGPGHVLEDGPPNPLLRHIDIRGTGNPVFDLQFRKMLEEHLEKTRPDVMRMAGMPRYIRGHQHAPRGVIMTVPDIDSRFMNERIKRGFVPMTPPPPRGAGGPQLPGFV